MLCTDILNLKNNLWEGYIPRGETTTTFETVSWQIVIRCSPLLLASTTRRNGWVATPPPQWGGGEGHIGPVRQENGAGENPRNSAPDFWGERKARRWLNYDLEDNNFRFESDGEIKIQRNANRTNFHVSWSELKHLLQTLPFSHLFNILFYLFVSFLIDAY